MRHKSLRSDAAIGIGIALFFIMGRFVAIPTPIPQTSLSLEFVILAVFAVIYGPRVGFWVGLIGNFLVYVTLYGVWWSWILPTGLYGLVFGLLGRNIRIEDGVFGAKQIVLFIGTQILVSSVTWIGIAPLLDVLMYSEPWNKCVLQGIVSFLSDVVTVDIAGTLVLAVYANTKIKKNSLRLEYRTDLERKP